MHRKFIMTKEEKEHILVEKVRVTDWDHEHLVTLEMDGSEEDIPTLFKNEGGEVVFKVPNSDIPKLCAALMMMHMDLA